MKQNLRKFITALLFSLAFYSPVHAAGWWFEVGLPPGSYNTANNMGGPNNNQEWSPMLGPYNTYHDCNCWDRYMMKRYPNSEITGCMGFFAGGADQFTCAEYAGERPIFVGK